MKLHRASRKPDWEKLRVRHRNYWQRLAASTNGIVTPGNAVSLAGLVLVLLGLVDLYYNHTWRGLILIVAGRVLDIVDGMVAEETGTKSPVGEAVDASIDKLEIAAALPVLVITNILLPWQAVLIALIHLTNAVLSIMAKAQHKIMHTSRTGKYATTLQWSALSLYTLAYITERRSVTALAGVVFGLALILSFTATRGYARIILRK